jgi:nanoRNase/pAp phosphatase (c-di-AMP/oligoRNAs hydrolase)
MAMLGLAIYSDTKAFSKADAREYQAMFHLMETPGVADAFGKLVEYTLPKSYFVQEEKAFKNLTQRDSWIITDLEFISSIDGDNIASFADKFARQEGVSLVLVFAVVDESYVRISLRSNDVAVPISNIMKKFGQASGFKITSNGKGEGGARMELSSMKPWFMSGTEAETLTLIRKAINELVF